MVNIVILIKKKIIIIKTIVTLICIFCKIFFLRNATLFNIKLYRR